MADRTCIAPSCEKSAKSRGLCGSHYMRWSREPETADVLPLPTAPRVSRRPPLPDIPCRQCGEAFTPRTSRAEYCSPKCCDRRRRPSRVPLHRRRTEDDAGVLKPITDAIDGGQPLGVVLDLLRMQMRANADSVESGCLLWTGSTDRYGYPSRVSLCGVKKPLHRHIVEIQHGALAPGEHAHHACAVRRCVNPAHLLPARAAENIAEMLARKSYEARITALESALAEHDPGHFLLTHAKVKI